MIFSDKIFKINNGKNISLHALDVDHMGIFLYNKTLRQYIFSVNNKKNCVFEKEYNHEKIIQVNDETYFVCNNGFISQVNKNEL